MSYDAHAVANTMNLYGVGAPQAKAILDGGTANTIKLDPVERSADKNFQKALYESLGDLAPLSYQLYNISKANSAWSAQQASDLRNWQEGMMKFQMDFNASEAAKNRDWQQMMSNTAHQREVKDLIAAGLNPVLSATGGNGAAVTSGSTASASLPSGAMGSADTSANQSIVGLLGSMLSAQTQLASTAMSAANNLAITEKNNITSKEIAELNNLVSERIADKYVDAQYVNGQLSYLASIYGADSARFASMFGSQLGYDASIYGTNMQEFLAANYPTTLWGTVSAGANGILGGSGMTLSEGLGKVGQFIVKGLTAMSNYLTDRGLPPNKIKEITYNTLRSATNAASGGNTEMSEKLYDYVTHDFDYSISKGKF